MSTSLLTIAGNRPQFIKMAPIVQEFNKRKIKSTIIHTGQHYDHNLSKIFFDEMDIPAPDISLKISGKNHGKMTAEILEQLEDIFISLKPRGILVFGDTNSTLAAALAAVKLKIAIAHVEAGPRIYDIDTPEEINRVITDKASRLLFCPDLISVQNLAKESMTEGVHFTGDVMYDAYLLFSEKSKKQSTIVNDLNLEKNNYILLSTHRPNNTDSENALSNLLTLFTKTNDMFVFPIHPRTEAALKKYHLWEKIHKIKNVKCIPAVGYLDVLALLNSCKMVITDSGGLQKEAYFAGKPALILFYTTPWPQIEKSGWQKVIGTLENIQTNEFIEHIQHIVVPHIKPAFFGNGNAAAHIVDLLEQHQWISSLSC